MLEDIENVVSNCFTCKRTNRAKIYRHPAQALSILGLLERVGIDLVLGLRADNPDQFNGILVITEFLLLLINDCNKSVLSIELHQLIILTQMVNLSALIKRSWNR